VATEAARLNRKNLHLGGKRKIDRKRKTDLTLTGLLMEGTDCLATEILNRLRQEDNYGNDFAGRQTGI